MSLRELVIMHQARLQDDWDHTATISWTIRDHVRMSKRRKVSFNPFHPYRDLPDNDRVKITSSSIGLLGDIFLGLK